MVHRLVKKAFHKPLLPVGERHELSIALGRTERGPPIRAGARAPREIRRITAAARLAVGLGALACMRRRRPPRQASACA